MQLHDLKPADGSTKKRKRIGRGPGSGHGKTACKGHKGQKARTGARTKRGFEGGQMPLIRRIPKRGFTNIFHKDYEIVKLSHLETFEAGTVVTPELLLSKGFIKNTKSIFKVLCNGELTKSVTVMAHKFSDTAKERIVSCGGKVEIIAN
ncbi:MAG: 50S ribosomal protein L15 [Candidatus Schekmanbacteria bacterium]|nr:50S ribosomal protein L15 [Candidatus Schekmanbacteria bacterium]